MDKTIIKSPRLYIDQDLKSGLSIELGSAQAHYLKNVLRKNEDDLLRLFNGRDGEWVGAIESLSKKSAVVALSEQLRAQSMLKKRVHIFFPPIKKNRLDFLIEKAVELGATDLQPVLTQNTETRKINGERLKAQITEAAEQCERLDIPKLHDLCDFKNAVIQTKIETICAIERYDAKEIKDMQINDEEIGFLAGPEGGFTAEEIEWLNSNDQITAVSLGQNILRSETAFVKFLSFI